MKRHRTILVLVILVLLASALGQKAAFTQPLGDTSAPDLNTPRAAQTEWREFSSRQGGFSVLMPGTPKEETEVKDFPVVGKGVAHLFILGNESGIYVASYLDVPSLAQQTQSFCDSFGKGFLRTIGEGTAKGGGGKVVKETDILFEKDPGKEILIQFPSGLGTARAYFIKRRGYQLIAIPPASGSNSGNVKKFLDSFKISAR